MESIRIGETNYCGFPYGAGVSAILPNKGGNLARRNSEENGGNFQVNLRVAWQTPRTGIRMNEREYLEAQRSLFASLAFGSATATVVPVRKEYANAAMCLTVVHLLREQLATDISREIIEPLRETTKQHYWYPAHDLHLTLKNVRNARPDRVYSFDEVERAVTAVERASRKIEPLDFAIHGPICFPTSIVLRAYGSLKHRDAVRVLDRELTLAEIPDDKTYASDEIYLGNITICRLTGPLTEEFRQAVADCEHRFLGTYRVQTVQLIQCDEVCSAGSRRVHSSFRLGT